MTGSTPNPADVKPAEAPAPEAMLAREALRPGIACVSCGYDLRGLTSERCPECGVSIVGLHSGQSLIPWVHRKHLGLWRAYWKTVWLVVRRPRHVDCEAERKVLYADATRFRWVTAAFATLPALLLIAVDAILLFASGGSSRGPDPETGVWRMTNILVIWILLMAGMPGASSWAFVTRRHNVERQNRLVALSLYAWAPLALLAIAAPVLALLAFILPSGDRWIILRGLVAAVAVLVYSLCLWKTSVFMARLLPYRFVGRVLRLAGVVGLHIAYALILLLIPPGTYFLLVVYHSLF